MYGRSDGSYSEGRDWMRFRSSEKIKREFVESRERQSEREFLVDCELASEVESRALEVRTAIASLAGVAAEHIRPYRIITSQIA